MKKLKKTKTAAKREEALQKLIDAELDSEKEVDEIILLTRRQTQ
jgi:cell division protein FtsW